VHLIQRGHNRGACFFADEDYALYLAHLAKWSAKFDCAVHAFVLMTNRCSRRGAADITRGSTPRHADPRLARVLDGRTYTGVGRRMGPAHDAVG
jgi:hypothetical protein